jgi:hypothetical protein
VFVAEDIHLEAIIDADLLDEGGHQPILELGQIVLFGQSNQIFGNVFMGDRIGVQIPQ